MELPVPSMAARLLPRPSTKVERHLLPELNMGPSTSAEVPLVCLDDDDEVAPTLPDYDVEKDLEEEFAKKTAAPESANAQTAAAAAAASAASAKTKTQACAKPLTAAKANGDAAIPKQPVATVPSMATPKTAPPQQGVYAHAAASAATPVMTPAAESTSVQMKKQCHAKPEVSSQKAPAQPGATTMVSPQTAPALPKATGPVTSQTAPALPKATAPVTSQTVPALPKATAPPVTSQTAPAQPGATTTVSPQTAPALPKATAPVTSQTVPALPKATAPGTSQTAPALPKATAPVSPQTAQPEETTPVSAQTAPALPKATTPVSPQTAPAQPEATTAVSNQTTSAEPAEPAATEEKRPLDEIVRAELEKLDDDAIKNRVMGAKKHCRMNEYLKDVALDEDYPFGENDEFEELVCFEIWLRESKPCPQPALPLPKAAPLPAPAAAVAPQAKVAAAPKAPPTRDAKSTTTSGLDVRVEGRVLWIKSYTCIPSLYA